jgi:hypothetical protein
MLIAEDILQRRIAALRQHSELIRKKIQEQVNVIVVI